MFTKISPEILPTMRQVQHAQPDVLTEIFEQDVNLVVWQRTQNLLLQRYTAELCRFSALQLVATPDELRPLLQQRLPEGIGKDEFITDLVLMAQMLCCLMDCSAVGFRLKQLDHAMCPRFHTDHVAVRLLVTYHGAGTEWLWRKQRLEDQNDIRQISCGDVALLKGTGWQDNEYGGIWHRSPSCNTPRLLLSLDPVGE